MGYMKFVILIPTERGTHRPVLEWDQEKIIEAIEVRLNAGRDLRGAFKEAIEEFKKGTTKLPY